MQPSRRSKDLKDIISFLEFLEVHIPSSKLSNDRLVNIVKGVFASDEVNVDDAINIGERIMMKIVGC